MDSSPAPNVLPIPGTSSVTHLRENVAAADLKLPSDPIRALEGVAATGGSAYARGSDAMNRRQRARLLRPSSTGMRSTEDRGRAPREVLGAPDPAQRARRQVHLLITAGLGRGEAARELAARPRPRGSGVTERRVVW